MALTGTALVKWTKNNEIDLAGYKIYYGTSPGVYTNVLDVGLTATPNVPQFLVTNLLNTVTYYFAVTAYNLGGQESLFSNEVQKTIAVPFFSIFLGPQF